MDKTLNINSDVVDLLKYIEKYGYKAYLVGGALRDAFLNVTPKDYDITTTMPMEKLEEIFAGNIISKSGLQFLSIIVMYNGKAYEITNTRIEGEYISLGYPSSVKYTDDIHADLKRRDYTINAICYSPSDGLIDDYGGITDLKNRTVKIIGNPSIRFREDPLRILRGIRLACKYNFLIDENTYHAMICEAYLLEKINYKKVQMEISEIHATNNIKKWHDFLSATRLFDLDR